MGTIMAVYEEREAQKVLLSCPGQGCEPGSVSLETQLSLPSYIGHFIILMFSFQLLVSKHRIQTPFQGRTTKTQHNQVLSHSVAHMLALPRPITSAQELLAALKKPAVDFSVLWHRFLLASFLFLFSSLQGCILRSCSSALPKPEPLSTSISANHCEQHLNPTRTHTGSPGKLCVSKMCPQSPDLKGCENSQRRC